MSGENSHQTVSQSVSHSVNTGGWCKFWTCHLIVSITLFLPKLKYLFIHQCMLLFMQIKRIGKYEMWQLMSPVILSQTYVYIAVKSPRNFKYSLSTCILRSSRLRCYVQVYRSGIINMSNTSIFSV